MNQDDIQILRANFKHLRKTKSFSTHQFIVGYLSCLDANNLINTNLYLRLHGIADDYIID